jgi:hypothetical protein
MKIARLPDPGLTWPISSEKRAVSAATAYDIGQDPSPSGSGAVGAPLDTRNPALPSPTKLAWRTGALIPGPNRRGWPNAKVGYSGMQLLSGSLEKEISTIGEGEARLKAASRVLWSAVSVICNSLASFRDRRLVVVVVVYFSSSDREVAQVPIGHRTCWASN